MIVAVEQTAEAPQPPHDRQDVPRTMAYDEFGAAFLRRVLHLQRVVESVDRILGPTIELGPIGAGPGRKIARLTASGKFLPSHGEVIPGPEVAYRVFVPLTVTFDIDLRVDTHRFHADIVIPLEVRLHLVEPLTIVWDLCTPAEDELTIELTGDNRRSTALRKLSGLDGEMRRFMLRFIERELDKSYVSRARHIAVDEVIDGAWEQIACQFLPNSPQDRIESGAHR
jgi:hypothetical protein